MFTELSSNILGALIAAFLLAQAAARLTGFGMRVLFVTLLGLFSSLDIHVSYWNWYGFPTSYTLAAMFDGVAGWCLAGVALAAIIKPATR